MSKIIKPVLIGAALIGLAFLTGGVSLAPTIGLASAGVGVGAAAGIALSTISVGVGVAAAGGILGSIGTALLIAGASIALSGVASAVGLGGAPKAGAAQLSRLSPGLDPRAFRKIVFGDTALALDTRYLEPSGVDQETFDYNIVVASHPVASIDELWFEDRLAWSAAGGIDPFYAGALTAVNVVLEGTTTNAIPINGGGRWDNSCRWLGCAYIHLRIKRTGTTKKAAGKLPSGLPGRVTLIGKAAKLYDPRRDSTVGGSGLHRANDQTTWEYASGAVVLGTNTALQHLFYQLGYRIGGKLAIGKGLPPARLDMASYIVAANLCDEQVLLLAGGSQRRYETHGAFSEGDATSFVNDTLCTSMNAEMTDANGRIGIEVAHNDLSGAIPLATADDVLSDASWDPSVTIHEQYNVVRGQFTDPARNVLFQMRDYPEVRIPSVDGIERPASLQLAMVQDGARAQRIVKQMLQRAQYSGIFGAEFGPRALAWKRGTVIKLTFPDLGFVDKLFRVKKQKIVVGSGRVELMLREEDPSIYAWDRSEAALVVVPGPILYDPSNNPLAIKNGVDIGVENGATVGATPAQVTAIGNALTAANAAQTTADGKVDSFYQTTEPATGTEGDLWFDTDDSNRQYRKTGASWVLVADTRIGQAITAAAGAQGTADGKVTTFVGEATPTATAVGDLWFKASTGELRRAAAAGVASWGAPLADVTALTVPSLSVPPSTTVNADAGGVVLAGQLPRGIIATRKRGDLDVSATTVWSVAVSNCAATIDASGNVTLTTCGGNGYIDVTSTRDAVTLSERIVVNKVNAAAAIVPPAGGGTATGSAATGINSASYGTFDSAELIVTAGSGGSVACTAPLGFSVTAAAPAGAFGLIGVWQWRAINGVFADILAEAASSFDAQSVNESGFYTAEDGSLTVNQTKTGLTPGTAYGFRLRLRSGVGTATRVRSTYNTISVVAS